MNLSQELEKRGLSVYRFAKEMGVTYNTAWRWVRNKAMPDNVNAKKIIKYFK